MLRVQIPLRRCVLDTTLCDQVWQLLAAGQWFSPVTPVASTNKSNLHDILVTEILLKVDCIIFISIRLEMSGFGIINFSAAVYKNLLDVNILFMLLIITITEMLTQFQSDFGGSVYLLNHI